MLDRNTSTYIHVICGLLVLTFDPVQIDGRVLFRKIIRLTIGYAPPCQSIKDGFHRFLDRPVPVLSFVVLRTEAYTVALDFLRGQPIALLYAYPP